MSEKIEISVQDRTKELVIRQGNAPDVELEKGVTISGNIFAPQEYYSKRKNLVDEIQSLVFVKFSKKESNPFIRLTINERLKNQTNTIEGKLEVDPEFAELQINKRKFWSTKELFDLLRFKKRFFSDPEQYASVVKGLQDFSAGSSLEVQDKNDFKGNIKVTYEKKASVKLDLSFRLNMPIYLGLKKVDFPVEINFDMVDGKTVFWLESIDLVTTFDEFRDNIFDAILNDFALFPIIEE